MKELCKASWDSETAILIRRWSLFTAVLMTIFWVGYWLVQGYVPEVKGVSRWWDILAGPFLSFFCIMWVRWSYLADEKFGCDTAFVLIMTIALCMIACIGIGLLYKEGVLSLVQCCFMGTCLVLAAIIGLISVICIVMSIFSVPVGKNRSLAKWLFNPAS